MDCPFLNKLKQSVFIHVSLLGECQANKQHRTESSHILRDASIPLKSQICNCHGKGRNVCSRLSQILSRKQEGLIWSESSIINGTRLLICFKWPFALCQSLAPIHSLQQELSLSQSYPWSPVASLFPITCPDLLVTNKIFSIRKSNKGGKKF